MPAPNDATPAMIQGILLAAGRGQRFDPSGKIDKLLQTRPDSGQPLLWHSAQAMVQALPGTLAVIQNGQDARVNCLLDAGCEVLVSPEAQQGMGSALAAAVRHCLNNKQDISGFVVALGDMPWITSPVIEQVRSTLEQFEHHVPRAVAPYFQGQRGHPVGLTLAWADSLLRLDGDVGAKHLLQVADVVAIDWPGSEVLNDVDTPQDLQGACFLRRL